MLIDTIDMLIEDEGYRAHAYTCPAGKITIGIGRNIDKGGPGISKFEAMILLRHDIDICTRDLIGIIGTKTWFHMAKTRKAALINMRFNLGSRGFKSFKKMIAAIKEDKWKLAAHECLTSKAAEQLIKRYGRIARMLKEGDKYGS